LTEVVAEELARAPTFTPYTVRPDIKNRAEVQRALEREYPSLLREAGLGGTVLVWFFIDEDGEVVRTQVHQSSGQKALDAAALKVADVIHFTPALNRDKRVPVWISLPITFQTR
jgi:protein TonB